MTREQPARIEPSRHSTDEVDEFLRLVEAMSLADGREATGQRGLGLSTRYSITSSARNRIACETVTPNARAVARLKTNS